MAAQIIQFPVQHSNGYNNLIQLFEICSSLESCNFYLESVEQLFQKGYISEKEMYTLRRIGRGKRLELAQPEEQEAQDATEPGVYQYTPEMGEMCIRDRRYRDNPGTSGTKVLGYLKKNYKYTVVEERTVNGVKWGKLKSGAGWFSLQSEYSVRC